MVVGETYEDNDPVTMKVWENDKHPLRKAIGETVS